MKQISFSEWGTITMIAIAVTIFASCNPYKQLAKRSPVTHADSIRLAYRCDITYPIDTTTKTRTEYIKGTDSSEILTSIIDSLTGVKTRIVTTVIEKYIDTCKGVADDVTIVCNACFDQGFAEGKQRGFIRVDTIMHIKTITVVDQRLITIANERVTVAETKAAKYKRQADRRKITVFILGGILLALLIGIFILIYKKLSFS